MRGGRREPMRPARSCRWRRRIAVGGTPDQIAEGVALVTAALPRGAVGPYQVQAAIAALHDEASSAEATDWPQIVALYEVLLQISDNPVVALNHAVAVAMVSGPAAGLELVAALDGDERIAEDHRLHAVRGHLAGNGR